MLLEGTDKAFRVIEVVTVYLRYFSVKFMSKASTWKVILHGRIWQKGIERALQHLTTRKHLSQCRKNQAMEMIFICYEAKSHILFLKMILAILHVCIKWKVRVPFQGGRKKKDVGTEWNWKKRENVIITHKFTRDKPQNRSDLQISKS